LVEAKEGSGGQMMKVTIVIFQGKRSEPYTNYLELSQTLCLLAFTLCTTNNIIIVTLGLPRRTCADLLIRPRWSGF
jgi:hypothetical protein